MQSAHYGMAVSLVMIVQDRGIPENLDNSLAYFKI